MIITGERAATLSNIAVAGRDTVTTVTEINVQPGERPLYVIATSEQPMIWNITGDANRIKRFVAGPWSNFAGRPDVGVAGRPDDRITFFAKNGGYGRIRVVRTPTTGSADFMKSAVEQRLNRPVSSIVADQVLLKVTIPSGKDDQPKLLKNLSSAGQGQVDQMELQQGVDRGTFMRFVQFSPGGVAAFSPKQIVSPGRVEPYTVLPQEAGLIQLMQQGKIEHLPSGHYLIKQDIPHFPAGLDGPHSVQFLLREGVPEPYGKLGSYTLRRE